MKRPFSLSPRLLAVAELVPSGAKLTDVGTDHGRLPIWLIQNDVIHSAVATDLREKPLNRARELAARWGVTDRVSFRLCDGLTEVASKEAQVVTITGMGGETIAKILNAVPWAREGKHRYILQPMSGADGLRRYLVGHGFIISREVLIEESQTLYILFVAEPGKTAPYTEGEIWVGRQSVGKDSPLRGRYLDQELCKLRSAVVGLAKARRPEEEERKHYFELVAQEVAQMKKEWDACQL